MGNFVENSLEGMYFRQFFIAIRTDLRRQLVIVKWKPDLSYVLEFPGSEKA
jgi:hypothetical protein